MTYSHEDQDWFLKLANTQYKWKAIFKMFLSRILGNCDQKSDFMYNNSKVGLPTTYLSINSFIYHPSTHPFIHLSVHPSIHLIIIPFLSLIHHPSILNPFTLLTDMSAGSSTYCYSIITI